MYVKYVTEWRKSGNASCKCHCDTLLFAIGATENASDRNSNLALFDFQVSHKNKKYYWFPLEVYPSAVVNREPLQGIS